MNKEHFEYIVNKFSLIDHVWDENSDAKINIHKCFVGVSKSFNSPRWRILYIWNDGTQGLLFGGVGTVEDGDNVLSHAKEVELLFI